MRKKNVEFLYKMTEKQLVKFYEKRQPVYRRLISKFTSLLKLFHGKIFGRNVATASNGDVVVKVSGGKKGRTKKNSMGAGLPLTVQKMSTPDKRTLKQFIDALDSRQCIDELTAMVDRFTNTENKAMNRRVPSLNRERDAMIAIYTEALHSMESVSEDHLPEAVGDLFKRVQAYFGVLDADYIKAKEAVVEAAKKAGTHVEDDEEDDVLAFYLNVGVEDDYIDFVLNCDISHWPAVQSTGAAKVVVITARLNPTDDSFAIKAYVNVLGKVALPGLYTIGSSLSGNNTAELASDLDKVMPRKFAVADIMAFAAPVDMDLDATEVTTRLSAIEGVTGVTVEPTEVTIEYPDGAREIQAQILRTMGTLPSIKALLAKEYEATLTTIDPGVHTYTLSIKG